MQYRTATICCTGWLLGVFLCACSEQAPVMRYSQSDPAPEGEHPFELYTTDPVLQAAAERATLRIQAAIGESGIALAEPKAARDCQPFGAGCGFQLSFEELVYCYGNPDPALACTSQGAGGKALGITMQASLSGDELDNRLIHELFHVITLNRAPHSADGLFMEYSVGTERISEGTLDSVCDHFSCSQFVVEESLPLGGGRQTPLQH